MPEKYRCKSVKEVPYEDGTYQGFWGGGSAWLEGQAVYFSVDSGVRTPQAPVTIVVENHIAYIYNKK